MKSKTHRRKGGGQTCTNYCSKTFKKDFTKRFLAYSRKVIKSKNFPMKVYPNPPSEEFLQKIDKLCLGNYCNPGCNGFDKIVSKMKYLYKKDDVFNDFHKKLSEKDIVKLKRLGANSTCVNPEDFYKLIFPELKFYGNI